MVLTFKTDLFYLKCSPKKRKNVLVVNFGKSPKCVKLAEQADRCMSSIGFQGY